MSNRRKPSRPPARRAGSTDRRTNVLLIAGLATVAIVAIGVAIAFAGSDDPAAKDDRPAYGPVVVEGTALPDFTSTADDPAVGMAMPRVEGIDPEGTPVTLRATGEPTLVAFLAHWCPHCQAEVPVLVDLMDSGQLEGVRVVGVLTSTSPAAPNFPPVPWLEREGWPAEVLLDDEDSSAMARFGKAGFPYLVAVDGDGNVAGRATGELPAAALLALVDLAR